MSALYPNAMSVANDSPDGRIVVGGIALVLMALGAVIGWIVRDAKAR